MADFPVGAEVLLLHAETPAPEPYSSSLHFGFATEGASVLGMPANFIFFTIFLSEVP